jgi:hypothetical protein
MYLSVKRVISDLDLCDVRSTRQGLNIRTSMFIVNSYF